MSLENTDDELDDYMKRKDYIFMQSQGDVEVSTFQPFLGF